MFKRLFTGFVLMFSVLLVNPVIYIQSIQEIRDINSLAISLPMPFQDYDVICNTAIDLAEIIDMAAKAEVNLFYSPIPVNTSGPPDSYNYIYLYEQKYLEQLAFVADNTVEDFNSSTAVYSTASQTHPIKMVLDGRKVTLTSLNNLAGELYGSIKVTGYSEDAIERFIKNIETNIKDVELTRDEFAERRMIRKAPLDEFMTFLAEWYFKGAEVGIYAVFILILLSLLMQISRDSRKITIQKAHGYSAGHIIISYAKDFLLPLFIAGNAVFIVGYFAYGAKLSSFLPTWLKFELPLLILAGIVCLLLILMTSFVSILQPIDLLKGKKSSIFTTSSLAIIKILLIVVVIPALVAQIVQTKEFWHDYQYEQLEREAFQDYHRVQTLRVNLKEAEFDYAEFYRRLEDTSIMFSDEIYMYGGFGMDEKLRLIMTNSEMVNQSELKAAGKNVHIAADEQVLIVSHDVDLDRLKQSQIYQDNFLCAGDLNQASCADVEIIQLDPQQDFLANNASRRSPTLERFVLTVNTYVPHHHMFFSTKT